MAEQIKVTTTSDVELEVVLLTDEGKTKVMNGEPIMSNEVINGKEEDWVNILIEEGDAIVARWNAEQERKIQEEMKNL